MRWRNPNGVRRYRARLRCPRRCCGEFFSARLWQFRAGERNIGQTLADDVLEGQRETECVIATAIVEAECLLIEVAEQMERFYGYVGALDGALQQGPEILPIVGVDVAVNVRLGVVDDVVDVFAVPPFVGCERVGVEIGVGRNMLPDGP
jgi:hypothetical protein